MSKIKKGAILSDHNHVIRHIPWSKLRRDEDDNVLGFLPQAFALRPNEEALSVNWLEIYDGSHECRIKKTIHELRSVQKINKKSAFGIANVGIIKEVCKKNNNSVKVVFTPRSNIPSHSEIRHFSSEESALLEALAAEAFSELIHNADIEEASIAL